MINNKSQKTITINGKRTKIYYETIDGHTHFLNVNLLRKQNVSIEQIKEIIRLHKEKDAYYILMKPIIPYTKKIIKYFKQCAKEITKIEYALQYNWNFKKNKKYHRFWEIPYCSCHKLDNADMYGTGYFIMSESCIFHGNN